MGNIYSIKFWMNIKPGELSPYILNLFFFTIIALVFITIIFTIIKKYSTKNYYSKFISNLHTLFLSNTIFGILYLFFTYELIPFLSSRFWFLIWIAGNIVWIIFIIKRLFNITEQKKEIYKEKEFKKYIPSKNK